MTRVALLLLIACGRVGFDPSTSDGDDDAPPIDGDPARLCRDVAVGRSYSCAIDRIGTVRCWGGNATRTADPTSAKNVIETPTPIGLPSPATQLAGGGNHVCALLETGDAYCWGSTQLLGNSAASDTGPVRVATSGPIAMISAAAQTTCAVLRSDGSVECWGHAYDGELGDGIIGDHVIVDPNPIPGLTAQSAIAGGHRFACSIASGTIRCWGRDRPSG